MNEYVVIALCFFLQPGASWTTTGDAEQQKGSVAFCSSYCDVYGYYKPQKYCVNEDSYSPIYCCGSENNRYCCSDASKDVGDMYPNVKSCPNSGMWGYQWRVVVSLLGSLLLMLTIAACCYYCCAKDPDERARTNRQRRRVEMTDANGNRVELSDRDGIIEQFDPESPYAFSPPEYDSLPKDPPKYLDICGEGHENTAFTEEHEMATISSAESTSASGAEAGGGGSVIEGATSSVESQNVVVESVASDSSPEQTSQISVETHNEDSQGSGVDATESRQTEDASALRGEPSASSGQVTQTDEQCGEQSVTGRNSTDDVTTDSGDQNDSTSQVTQNGAAAKREDQNGAVAKSGEAIGKSNKKTKKETVTSEDDDVFHDSNTQGQNSVTNISVQSAQNNDEISVHAVPNGQTIANCERQSSDLSEVDV